MGDASGSEGDFEQFLGSLFDLDEQEGSLSYILTRAKRPRSKNWISVERTRHLEAMLEAVRGTVKGKKLWEFISQRLREGSGRKFLRSAKECEYFWGTLRKAYRAIEQHEKLVRGGPQTSVQFPRTVSYFEMDEKLRSRYKFLPLPCYQLMHTILVEQEKKREKKEEKRKRSADHVGSSHTIHPVVEEDLVTQLSSRHRLESSIAEQSANAVNSCFESLRCRYFKVDSQYLSILLAPDVKEQVIAAVIAAAILNVRILESKEYRFDVDDSVAELASFVAKFIKDALKSAIEPVSYELEALERQMRRRDILEKRWALDREEKELEEKELEESKRRQHAIGRFT